MKKRIHLFALYSSICICLSISYVQAQVFIDMESGVVFTGYNDVRIPGTGGSLFSLKSDLNANPTAFVRFRAGYTMNSRHTVSILYAPLTVKSDGSSEKQIDFEGLSFPANTSLNANYTFNSYRITYRYDLVKSEKYEVGLGFTAKIRDAGIALESQDLAASKTNVGFVPIINFRVVWKINENIGLLLEGDALGARQGRAEDVLLAGTYNLSDHFKLRAGYRILEGGADGSEVYNFAFFNFASAGLLYTF